EEVANFVAGLGATVSLERETALNTGITAFEALSNEQLGAQCDLAIVLGGDGTMLGFAREMARFGVPLVGINQ
ncbi:NAD(+)/NADH kinase, partial [Roseateles sp. GG27B]